MNVDLGIWGKLNRLILFLLLLAVMLGAGIWFWPLLQQNERMRKVVLRLDAQIQQEEDLARQLDATTRALRTDPRTVERLARERLGYARPGQTVIRFESPRQSIPSNP